MREQEDFPNRCLGRLSLRLVTEIPEHLLKRSQARRGEAPAAPAAATPATTAAATPAAAAPATPAVPAVPAAAKPDIPVVAAYKARKKIPAWAMVTLSILPVWLFLYVLALRPEPAKASGPLTTGASIYTGKGACSGCHGAAGEGGLGYAFNNGQVMLTFPHIEDQLRWVKLGTVAYQNAGVEIYGDPNREGGPHIAGVKGGVMPGQAAALTDAEILAVVCEERYGVGGGDEASAEFTTWCADGSAIYAALLAGDATFDDLHTKFEGVLEIGSVPLAGTTADA